MPVDSKTSEPGQISWDELWNVLMWGLVAAAVGAVNYVLDSVVPVMMASGGYKAIAAAVVVPALRLAYLKWTDSRPEYH